MQRSQLEHIIRAAAAIADCDELTIIGSQAILGQYPSAPAELLRSVEADVYPTDDPAKAELIDGCIGEQSAFHALYGYYAHGVGPETAILAAEFRQRLIAIRNENTNNFTGWCLEAHDLALSKLAAAREKDLEFVRDLLRHEMVTEERLRDVAHTLPLDKTQQQLIVDRIQRLAGNANK